MAISEGASLRKFLLKIFDAENDDDDHQFSILYSKPNDDFMFMLDGLVLIEAKCDFLNNKVKSFN